MISKLKPRMFLLNLKNGKCKTCIMWYSTLKKYVLGCHHSSFYKQTASPLSLPTKVTAKNIFLLGSAEKNTKTANKLMS